MSKDKFKEEEKRIATELMKKSKEQIIELYLQVKFERDYLQAQYEKAIVPKFKIGQEVLGIDVLRKDNIDNFVVKEICFCADYGLYYKTNIGVNVYEYYYKLFATEEEAEAKLKELQNGQ